MTTSPVSRRAFVGRVAAAAPIVAVHAPWCVSAVTRRAAGLDDGISRTAESIHQVATFQTTPARVYDALIIPEQFAKVTGRTAQIGRDPGGAFSLFGGLIGGRHVELVPAKRIVQAWRAESWPAGLYSIARFELIADGAETRVEFDHTGFPNGAAEHLATGWKEHYWALLTKYFAST